jgi:hypothetical protein
VVVTDDLPRKPLAALGLSEFAAFENEPIGGLTFLEVRVETLALPEKCLP